MSSLSNLFIVVAGPSGSGKTTYVQSLLTAHWDLACVSPDDLRLELTGDMSNQSRNGFIFGTLLPIRINGLRGKLKGCVVDATSVDKRARKTLIEYAKTAGYTRIECHVIRATKDQCIARNRSRDRQVPDDVIERQFARWQEPELTEGFDLIKEIST